MEWWQVQELMMTSAAIVAVLVPVFALTYRFVLKPARRDHARLRGDQDHSSEILRDVRLDNMERQLEGLEASVQRLVDVTEFDRQLKAGKPPEESS
jgi:hypothetical protein